jgi:adenylate kinase
MNILIFGPNGSGKGTQGTIIQKKFGVPHIETGVIFRENISKGTELGKKAKGYIDRGELVPDDITIPMILNRLKEADCAKGWLLDGFPRNLAQAEALWNALQEEKMQLDYVIEIVLDRDTSKSALWVEDFVLRIIIIPTIFTLML